MKLVFDDLSAAAKCSNYRLGKDRMNDVKGLPGELLDRLIELLNSDALGDGHWSTVSFYASYFLGGRALLDAVPDTGPPVSGSVGEARRQQHEVVNRMRYFELLKERIDNLVTDGLEEAFLVRSVRDAVRQELEHVADVGAGDRSREEMRTRIEEQAEDPAGIEAFRRGLTKYDPSAESLTDEEIAARLRNMAKNPILGPISADEATQNWALLTHWDQQAAGLLPDTAFSQWRRRRART
jgi:hypothetical protein